MAPHSSIMKKFIFTCLFFQVKRGGNKNVTPYIIFASQIRKKVSDDNKGATFGEISKIVGDQVSFMSKIFKRIFCTFSFQLLKTNQVPTKGRVRTGYQIFSSQIWLRVKSEMASGNFAEISREIGNQVNQYLPSFFSRDSSCSSSKKTENPFMIFKNTFFLPHFFVAFIILF